MPIPSHPSEPVDDDSITKAELALATRNHGMPLESMRWDLTPVGLHYLLVHYDVPLIEASAWRLDIGGAVSAPATMSLEQLHAMPSSTVTTTMECAGNGRALLRPRALSQPWLLEAVGTAEWTGVRLADVVAETGLRDDAVEMLFTGADRGMEAGVVQRYERALSIDDALLSNALLAFAMNGQPLPPQHGFPLRLVLPGWYGMTNVKWLTNITAITEPFTGYQNASAYRLRESADDPGVPVTRILPRSLLVPPGIPDFYSRQRLLGLGPCTIEGRAWSGWAPIETVEVSVDGGKTWQPAVLDPAPDDPHAWRRFTFWWAPTSEGDYELRSRCRDRASNAQPTESVWNRGGYSNNAAQRVLVTVVGD
jgi:sulfane dehydrogenase subunit SoxC